MIIISVVVIASFALLLSGYFIYKNAESATKQALQMQAIGITITLKALIQASDIETLKLQGSSIFSEILLDEKWQGVAFIALYSMDGKIVLHSNPELIGEKTVIAGNLIDNAEPYYHYLTLGTGETVFISDTKILLKNRPYILRVALHTYPAEAALRTARMHLLFMITVVIVLVAGGVFSSLLVGRIEKMQAKMQQLEHLSVVSKILAHEIRNPLGSIKGFAQYLMKKITDPSLNDHLNIIVKESLRLERLTDELTVYANPSKIIETEVELDKFFSEVILPFREKFEDIKFNIEIPESLKIRTDADKLKQIFVNIIQNAVDALEFSSEREISVKALKTNGKIKVEVVDTGTGMDEETLNQATEPFFTTKSKGTGLGLAIVKRLCEVLKIDFEIKSKKGQGTKVCLSISEWQ